MKKTLVLGVSTAIVMTALSGCTFDKPITTKYGIDPPNKPFYKNFDEPVPDVYGTNPKSNKEEDINRQVILYGPPIFK